MPNPAAYPVSTATLPIRCYHCGDDCPDTHHVHDGHDFCCAGCQTVYDLLKENDLCQYYSVAHSSGIAPDLNVYDEKFNHLDLAELRPKLLEFADGRRERVNWLVPKMHCSSCIWLLERLSSLHPGISSSVVNFPEKTVRIALDPKHIKLSELAGLMTRIGYEPYFSLNDVEDDQGKPDRKEGRKRLYKIGVAGFAFGNIMMLSLPEYFNLGQDTEDQQLRWLFNLLNLSLALPVVLYSASDFFTSAWKALRERYLTIDAPIALALLAVFMTSLYQIATRSGPGYLDSLAGAVFFMLLGRYFQDRTYTTIAFNRDYKSYFPIAAAVLTDGIETWKPIKDLRAGDRIRVRNRELIPADTHLLSDSAYIDYSFVSGEANPVKCLKGDILYAGGRQCGPAIELEIVRRVSHSYLTQLWNNDAFTEKKADPNQTLAGRINRYFSAGVLLLALVTFLVWSAHGQWETAFLALTTVLLVACPCALLLSSTFTYGNLLNLFGKHGLYFKNANAIERLSKIDTVVLDKTGTVTLPHAAEIKYMGSPLSTVEQEMVKTLAAQSSHPLSVLIAGYLKGYEGKQTFTQFEEKAGAGMQAKWEQQSVRMGSLDWVKATGGRAIHTSKASSQYSQVHLAIAGEIRGFFDIRPSYRPGLPGAVADLQKENYSVYLLSGDQPTDQEFLKTVFKNGSQLFFNQKPHQKLEFIRQLQTAQNRKVLMVGDGLNDAGALRQSDIGLAVSDHINNFSPACDALMEGKKLCFLPRYIRLAQAGQRIIKISFGLSLLYNVAGISFAVTGQLTPVVAAILMPLSSITVVLFTTVATNRAANRWLSPT